MKNELVMFAQWIKWWKHFSKSCQKVPKISTISLFKVREVSIIALNICITRNCKFGEYIDKKSFFSSSARDENCFSYNNIWVADNVHGDDLCNYRFNVAMAHPFCHTTAQ